MKTKMKHIAAAALCVGLSVGAAQAAEPFTGWGLGVGVYSSNNKIELAANNQPASGEYNVTQAVGVLQGTYGWVMANQWIGSVGLAYDLNKNDFGAVQTSGGAGEATGKGSAHFVLSFAPGYRVSGNGLVYGKLALHQINMESTWYSGAASSTKTLGGTGWGLGYAMALTSNHELRAEYEITEFEKWGTSTPRQSRLGLAWLYKF